ncbi:MAG: LL-diaminopimelate aminotransferase, partial [Phycisphaerae bacterium]
MKQRTADRLSQLPPYLFVEIDERKRNAIRAGRDIIDFGVGDPDHPTPGFIVDRMAEAIRDPANHPYSLGRGMPAFREAAARFMDRRYGVRADPATEVVALLGSKEGIGHLAIAAVNPGDLVLVPEPGYPVYVAGTVFAGGTYYTMPLYEQNGWLPVLDDIPVEVRQKARLMWINYPNNPTGAVAPLSFYEEVIAFAREYDILVASDAPYCELYFDDPPPSILQVKGATDLSVEFHSFSKTFNMTGWRLAFAVGHFDVLTALAKVKANLDSGIFQAIQHAGIAALDGIDRPEIREQMAIYRRRRDILVSGLRDAGWPVTPPKATFYVWAKCPVGQDSMTVSRRVLDEADCVVIPGAGFGP